MTPTLRRQLSTLFQNDSRTLPTQKSSKLLSLPFELRTLIFSVCLSNHTIHLFLYSPFNRLKWHHPSSSDDQPPILPLLLSCRQIYIETTPLLYTTNRIKFTLPLTISSQCLNRLLPPHRGPQIRDLWFQWHVQLTPKKDSPEHEEWRKVWEALAEFKGLRRLWVDIVPIWADRWAEEMC
ncbi:uncharacterized protein LY89DRAFT_688653 [Mollisia scopiformis]|uniref:DUF7730 domain-containing protein n=1 Tax=Mollisia scopiformis TaxID=149040 RepID=A0A194WW58_MOLSC|nr:uncharacterized protein LY89DRAFT_688653 [Mollisia scopiformis]KUJ12201.1 hypothetical protein LY89DRAFT_688653 [Mollisia scopiformis]